MESVFSVTPVEPDIIPTDTGDVAPPTVIPGDSSATPVEPDIIPTDTGEVAPPTVIPGGQTVYVPTIREGDNVTEFEHNPVEGKAEQEFAFSLEGEELRIKGTLMARGYDKHYIHCQIIGDSVHLQRYDMDPKSTDMILHHIDIRIPGFTGDYYHVTLAEQNDIPLYKQYMMASKTVMRDLTGMEAATASAIVRVQTSDNTLTFTAPNAVKLEVYTTEAMKVDETEFTNGTATVKVGKAPAAYLYIVTYPNGRRESGKVMVKE